MVSHTTDNPVTIDGIPVIEPEKIPFDALIVVAVTELLQGEIASSLTRTGFSNIFLLTAHEEHLLMSSYFASLGKFPIAEERDNKTFDFAMYEVCNHRDKPLAKPPKLLPFEHKIQAGAYLTDKRIAALSDNTGANISRKNKQYCEMTATYWVWKNTSHEWVGIEHYRRHLLVKPTMLKKDLDAILPLPYICYPNEITQFRRFVSEDVLNSLLKALKDLHPNEYENYLAIMRGKYQYTYNLLCAKRNVFDDYCNWFFRITEYMENMSDITPEIKDTRALSYVAEVLTNIYFVSRQDVWVIHHVEKSIYI